MAFFRPSSIFTEHFILSSNSEWPIYDDTVFYFLSFLAIQFLSSVLGNPYQVVLMK